MPSFLRGLRFKFLLTFLIVSMAPGALFSIITYSTLAERATKESVSEANLVLNQIRNTLDISISEIQRVALVPNYDMNTQESLMNRKLIITDMTKPNESLYSRMNFFTQFSSLPYCSGVSIFHNDGSVFYTQHYSPQSSHLLHPLMTESWFEQFSKSGDSSRYLTKQEEWADLHSNRGEPDDYFGNWAFSYVQKLYSYPENVYSGAIVMDITKDMFEHIFDGVNRRISSQLFIYDPQQKQVLYQNSNQIPVEKVLELRGENEWKEKSDYEMIDGRKILVSQETLQRTGWIVMSMVPHKEILKKADVILYTFSIVLIICLVLTVILSFFFAKGLTQPIMRLRQSMQSVEDGDLQVRFEGSQNDEIGYLGKSFNQMLEQLDKYLLKNFTLELLRSQINPHFLYNSLGTIASIAQVRKVPEIHTLALSLSKLFRYSINQSGRLMVTFEEELDILKSYIDAQKIRFGDHIRVEWDIEKNVYTRRTIKLTLQPILENAFAHGIEPKGEGIIRITGKEIDGDIVFEIRDDGMGIESLQLERLRQQLEMPLLHKGDQKNGFGLTNVHNRVRLTFGQPYGIQIFSVVNEGTTVIIKMPIIEQQGGV